MTENIGVIRYHHIAITCTSIERSTEFYQLVGFVPIDGQEQQHQQKADGNDDKAVTNGNGNDNDKTKPYCILKNESGLELHLFETSNRYSNSNSTSTGTEDASVSDDTTQSFATSDNILMDVPNNIKYPGHTHISFGVPSVTKIEEYFTTIVKNVPISGRRPTAHDKGIVASIFVRDPDRTVLEFERNDGLSDISSFEKERERLQKEGQEVQDIEERVYKTILSNPPRGGIDHVGTRVSQPYRAKSWYEEYLGFTKDVLIYPIDSTDPLKNFIPWIVQTEPSNDDNVVEAIDINLLLNSNAICDSGNRIMSTSSSSPTTEMTTTQTVIPPPNALFPSSGGTTSKNGGDNVIDNHIDMKDGKTDDVQNSDPFPGILYVAYEVYNIEKILATMKNGNDGQSKNTWFVASTVDDLKVAWGVSNPNRFVYTYDDDSYSNENNVVKSCFVRDYDSNWFRLIEKISS